MKTTRPLTSTMSTVIMLASATALYAGAERRTVWLSDLDISKTEQAWGTPQANRSVDGNRLCIGGTTFERGLGTHAESVLQLDLGGGAVRFQAMVGVDSEVEDRGTVQFRIVADGTERYRSDILRGGQAPCAIDIDVTGVQMLILMVLSGGDDIHYDHADWADARIEIAQGTPKTVTGPREEAVILTPPPPPTPRINGARIFGVRPGSPILYTIAATGTRPMTFAAEQLPAGCTLDSKTGRLQGTVAKAGTYKITLIARNALGEARQPFRLVVGDTLALTPPMGWNSWNCWAAAVDAEKIRASAQAMVDSGLINHGWQYINIDDCWMVKRDSDDPVVGGKTRDATGRILTNKKFPDMPALTEHIHDLGLKIGVYISPGPWTCQGYEGSWKHEEKDAQRFAEWGFDYLKYDWCGYSSVVKNPSLEQLKAPYSLMKNCLDAQDRDIVYSLCQYGMGKVWEWGAEVGGNCWRTTGDIVDSWGSMSGIGFAQDACAPYGGPGHWNDPDMLVVGKVGWGPTLRPSRLTPNEQYTHISLWCLLCSPLLLGCDLTDLDPFTLNLLTNDEVLEVNQDPLGEPARRVVQDGYGEVWAKHMEDGSVVAGLFNRDILPRAVTVRWRDLGIAGPQRVRDLWRQQDLGVKQNQFEVTIPRHGVLLIRLWQKTGTVTGQQPE